MAVPPMAVPPMAVAPMAPMAAPQILLDMSLHKECRNPLHFVKLVYVVNPLRNNPAHLEVQQPRPRLVVPWELRRAAPSEQQRPRRHPVQPRPRVVEYWELRPAAPSEQPRPRQEVRIKSRA